MHMPSSSDSSVSDLPLLPPLATRVRGGHIVLGLLDDPALPIYALLDALGESGPLPFRIILFGQIPTDTSERIGIRAVEHCSLDPARLAATLPQLEACCLPAHLASDYLPLLTRLAVPCLTVIDGPAETARWQGAGLAVAGAEPGELAALLQLLATDPPTRRRALAGQRRHFEDEGLATTWRVEGVFDSSYSLAIVNRRFALGLNKTALPGEEVALFTFEQGEDPNPRFDRCEEPSLVQALWERSKDPTAPVVAFRDAWPPVVRDMRGHHRVLSNYGWEESGFPRDYAQDFNRVLDLVTTLSSQTARFLQDAGTDVPMAVAGAGVDHLIETQPEPPPMELPPGYRFLHVSSCLPRKGVDVLLQAYGKAFRDRHEVSLIIKTYPNPHNDVAAQVEARRKRDPHYPRVIIRQDDWTPAQIAGLYQACHALVAPSRGEGFGLPIAEAMLHRIPAIVTGWGGHMDFCDESVAWLLNYRLAQATTHLSQPGSLWAEPDAEHLQAHMRALYLAGPDSQYDKLELARQRILERYSWRQVAERNRRALKCVQEQPGPLPQPRLGWIGTWGSRCGIAAYSGHLSAAFPRDGFFVLAPDNETPEYPDPSYVSRVWSLGGNDRATVKRLVQIARERALDVCVIQHHWTFFDIDGLTALIGGLTDIGVHVILDMHNTKSAPPSIARPAIRRVLRRCGRILVHGLDDMHRLQDWGLIDIGTLFPLAVYAVEQPDAESQARRRASLELPEGPLLATFGYLMPHKGLMQMVDAMPSILERHPDARLLMLNSMYNDRVSPPELDRLQTRIEELGIADHIRLETRYLSEQECVAMLGLADLIVFPYQHTEESSSAAVRMAIAAGRPIAVTPLPLFADVAGATLSLPGTDADAIGRGTAAILDDFRDPQAKARAASKAREFADLHDSRRLAERLRGLVTGVVRTLHLEEADT